MKIKSFGDSFIYGSDVEDWHSVATLEYSLKTWPALVADRLGVDYECLARPGQGNFKIYCDLLSELEKDTIYIIGWTWNDRFDFVNNVEEWRTIRPSGTNKISNFYYKNLHSQITDMIRSATYINSAIELLQGHGLPFLMTNMDYTTLESIDPDWQNPRYLETLQKRIKSHLRDFDGKNFLDWSRDKGFEISPAWHPLEQAHKAAADYFLNDIKALIN